MDSDQVAEPATVINNSGSIDTGSTENVVKNSPPPNTNLSCKHCGKEFSDARNKADHMKKHRSERRYPCSQCAMSFDFMANLKEHYRIHTGEKPYRCKECEKGFKRSCHLTRHVMVVHLKNLEKDRHKFPKQILFCRFCGKKFKKPDILAAHEWTHNEDDDDLYQGMPEEIIQQYLTDGDSSSRPDTDCRPESDTLDFGVSYGTKNLNISSLGDGKNCTDNESPGNIAVASGDIDSILAEWAREGVLDRSNPKCQQCGQTFALFSSLRRHLRTHSGEKLYKCRYCGLKFELPAFVRRHELTHTGQWSVQCDICDMKFDSPSSLSAHSRCHTGEKPYSCFMCGTQFSYNYALQIHIQSQACQSQQIRISTNTSTGRFCN